jgi:hypothetical protein
MSWPWKSDNELNTAINKVVTMNKPLPFIDAVEPAKVDLIDGYGGILSEYGPCSQGTNWYLRLKDGDFGSPIDVIIPSIAFGAYWFHSSPLAGYLGRGHIQVCVSSQGKIMPWNTSGMGSPAMMTLAGQLNAAESRVKDLENKVLQLTKDLARQAVEDNKLKKELGITQTITTKEDEEANKKDKR